ncbi:vegetative incompatibility het-e-1 [Trichoderma arundinaceum]|uniref:Vegetative incompatibility het-e-1 n=1 Tax=Trichoderma arundinaceum TaxID=490622 RepID=A0A395P131_TRIAR|nr:vegetative incompatibility het-e-1 [Trichoderma arundinaceum]
MTTRFSMMDKLQNFIDSPQAVLNLIDEWGDSQDKLRAALNIFFVPTFRPNFIEDGDVKTSVARLDDVEFLGAPRPQETQSPRRMFDVDQGNLVEWPTKRSHYCMLSHRWKGAEITLQDIYQARREYQKLKKQNPDKDYGKKNDVQIVLDKCIRDIRQQATIIEKLAIEAKVEHNIYTLLEKRLNDKRSDEAHERAINDKDETNKRLIFAAMEKESFQNHIQARQKEILKAGKRVSYSDVPKEQATAGGSQNFLITNQPVTEAEKAVRMAAKALDEAEEEYKKYQDDRKFFDEQPELKDEVNELVRLLQQWKSAVKIQQSVLRSREIFNQKPFGEHKKRYVWLDTCCINKQDADELSRSLSLMGDWYAQSEFTLVQLDAGKSLDSNVKYEFSDYDAKYDWLQFQAEDNRQDFARDPSIPTLNCFSEIRSKEPEWSERGWTLQELVMSKMTFYVNSDWQPLSRPIEELGRFYHLIPYICLYLGHDDESVDTEAIDDLWKICNIETLYAIVSQSKLSNIYQDIVERCIENQKNKSEQADDLSRHIDADTAEMQVTRALLMLAILDGLNVRFPKEMTKETAKFQMAQAVFFAVNDLTREENGVRIENALLDALKDVLQASLPGPTEGDDETKVAQSHADYIIDFIMRLLVIETNKLIQDDRKYVAEFGKVELLKEWALGTQSTGFVTQDVMTLSRHRKTTVPIDHVYALMGIMGVRFPTFPAEGYCKALSRLLDEIIVTHNDVSVFNWTGVDMISPIRGRSMYPSSHEAYAKDSDRNRQNSLIWKQTKGELDDLTASYHDITSMLRNAINLVKDKKPKNTPMRRIDKILEITHKFSLPALKPEIMRLHQIITHIIDTYDFEEKKPKETTPTSPTQAPRLLSSSIRTFSSGISQIKEQKNSIRRNMFGRKKSEPEQPQVDANQEPPSPSLSTTPTLVEIPVDDSKTFLIKDDEEMVDSYLDELASMSEEGNKIPGTRKPLPDNITNIKIQKEVHGLAAQRDSANKQASNMICPNPIIINNAGIEGTFDIQRVIITMTNKEKLRRQVAQAVSPKQRISGWCTISTGFANVVVNFSCEKQHLENQLHVVDGVEKNVLEEQSERRLGHIMTEMVLHKVSVKSKDHEDSHQGKKKDTSRSSASAKYGLSEDTLQGQQPEANDNARPDNGDLEDLYRGEDERLVSRMIGFIQEEDMRLVAGEWVLARFSGVEGAKWFLCSLELGSAHHFYGHRIATSEIDFGVAAPEAGLVEVWKNYMNRKKRKMGYILAKYLQSRNFRETGPSSWTELLPQGMSFNALYSPTLRTPDAMTATDIETGTNQEDDGNDSDDSDDTVSENQPSGAKDLLQAMGEISLLKIFEFIAKSEAKHLERHLSSMALKETPKILHPAIENLNDNRDFLPAMFHSGKRVHMF